MPANLSPEYIKAEEKYKNAKTSLEKLEALHEMLSTIPKHKGTEKMQADIKRRIAKLSESSGKKGAKRTDFYFVPKEGAGQVVLAGLPNSGKSSLLKKLTNAHPVIGEYPFSTTKPIWGMIFFENIQIQLVDIPPVAPEFLEGWVFGIIRNADLIIIVVDISNDNSIQNIPFLFNALNENKIFPVPETVPQPEDPAARAIKTLIAANKKAATEQAIFQVQTEAADYAPVDAVAYECYQVFDDTGNSLGYALPWEGNGFQGKIRMMIGITADLTTLTAIEVLDQVETPGLGTKVTEDPFRSQFNALSAQPQVDWVKGAPTTKDNQVETITGATITSVAIVDIVNDGLKHLRRDLAEGGKQ